MDLSITHRATLEDRPDAQMGETLIAHHHAGAARRIETAQPGVHFLVDRRARPVMTEGGTLMRDVEAAFAAGGAERGARRRFLNTPRTVWPRCHAAP